MNRSSKPELLADLKELASRAYDAHVTVSTQRAIDYAISELAAEADDSRPSQSIPPPTANDAARNAASAKFKKARELLQGIK